MIACDCVCVFAWCVRARLLACLLPCLFVLSKQIQWNPTFSLRRGRYPSSPRVGNNQALGRSEARAVFQGAGDHARELNQVVSKLPTRVWVLGHICFRQPRPLRDIVVCPGHDQSSGLVKACVMGPPVLGPSIELGSPIEKKMPSSSQNGRTKIKHRIVRVNPLPPLRLAARILNA